MEKRKKGNKIEARFVSAMEKVFFDGIPKNDISRVSMLKNERLNVQACFRQKSFRRVRYEIFGELASYVLAREVDYGKGYYNLRPDSDDYFIFQDGRETLYPDILRPITGTVALYPDSWAALWLTVYSTEDLPCGNFGLGVRVYDEGGELLAEEVLNVDVIDERLVETDLIVSNWLYCDSICMYHGVEIFSEDFYSLLGEYLNSACRHGVNTLYVPLFTPPLDTQVGKDMKTVQAVGVYKNNGRYSFDFSQLKRLLVFARERKIRYFELSHLATQWGAKYAPKIMAMVDGVEQKIFGWSTYSLGAEYVDFLSAFLPELTKFLKEENLTDCVLAHISDEPRLSHLDDYIHIKETVKRFLGDIPICDALSSYEFFERKAVDLPIVDIAYADKFVKAGVRYMAYYYCANHQKYISNRFLSMPSQRNRILGAQLYLNNAVGFLHWGFNFYKSYLSKEWVEPFMTTDAGGMFQSGDSFVVYPSEKGVWESLRLEVFSDAMSDYRALKTLEKKKGREYVCALLTDAGMRGYVQYDRDDRAHFMLREKINACIADTKPSCLYKKKQ